ncbi:hypothetical protein B0J11DRAFT_137281 [Dendryphion nanum]|uniref:Uncharacterized protein n=1 Tax=Dendryphion nanum TaxID=256645 RepID=A0A9P9IC37_9PLEO|nr:hypothetical protein B0J11DRAFT_137281 [Dendryphion nanum]
MGLDQVWCRGGGCRLPGTRSIQPMSRLSQGWLHYGEGEGCCALAVVPVGVVEWLVKKESNRNVQRGQRWKREEGYISGVGISRLSLRLFCSTVLVPGVGADSGIHAWSADTVHNTAPRNTPSATVSRLFLQGLSTDWSIAMRTKGLDISSACHCTPTDFAVSPPRLGMTPTTGGLLVGVPGLHRHNVRADEEITPCQPCYSPLE